MRHKITFANVSRLLKREKNTPYHSAEQQQGVVKLIFEFLGFNPQEVTRLLGDLVHVHYTGRETLITCTFATTTSRLAIHQKRKTMSQESKFDNLPLSIRDEKPRGTREADSLTWDFVHRLRNAKLNIGKISFYRTSLLKINEVEILLDDAKAQYLDQVVAKEEELKKEKPISMAVE